MKAMRNILTVVALCAAILMANAKGAEAPKREFRGAWMSTVFQDHFAKRSTEANKKYISDQLDKMQAAGINAVLFQARPSADAFYASKLEPWSRFISPTQVAPKPFWDPLEYIIDEAHRRGMELHAWLNPYRVTTVKGQTLPKGHLYHKEPGRFVKYEGDGRIYFDPGQPKNREFIVSVVKDIITRYDVDGIHFDDYFYPYPANGKDFNDSKSFAKYGKGMKKADWRRRNVDMLIENIHNLIAKSDKPWIRFGISPFGIWRNSTSDKRGSKTNGLQNYDDLYADVLLWAEKGWIDYLIPQLYWELDHKRASSLTLIDWWAKAVDPRCHLYIGQSIERTMKAPDIAPSKEKDQLRHKVDLSRTTPGVLGNCWWPCYDLTANQYDVATRLKRDHHQTIALVPAHSHLCSDKPGKVTGVKADKGKLTWDKAKPVGKTGDHTKYVVYRFDNEKSIDLEDAKSIVAVTPDTSIKASKPGIYIVTALDRVNNESEPSDKVRVK